MAARILAECSADQSCNGKHDRHRRWMRSVHAAVCIHPCLYHWESLKGGKTGLHFDENILEGYISAITAGIGVKNPINYFYFFKAGVERRQDQTGVFFSGNPAAALQGGGGGTLTKLSCTPLSHRRIIHLRRPRDASAGPSPPEGLRGGCRRPGFAWVSLSAPPHTGGGGVRPDSPSQSN